MAYLADDDLIRQVRNAIEYAVTATDSGNGQRQAAWNQFTLAPTGTETDESGAFQSPDINSMITAQLAQMVIAFSADDVVTFEPESADDEEPAAAESRVVNKMMMQNNDGFSVLLAAMQNALLFRNGYVKVFWDSEIEKINLSYKGIEPEDLPILTEVDPSEIGTQRRLVSYDQDSKKARVETTKENKQLRIKPVANERFFYTPDWDELQFSDCPVCGEIHYKTRNELVRMGVDQALVDQIPAVQRNSGMENSRRNLRGSTVDAIVKGQEICRVYEAYVWLNMAEDEDDHTYLYQCWIGDGGACEWLLDPKPVNRNPYAAGTAFPVANQHTGEALSDKLASVQAGKTEMLRQWFSNVQNISFGRFGAVVGQVELDDVMRPKAGGVVRMKRNDAIVPIPIADAGPSIVAALQYLDKQRTEQGGAAVDMMTAEAQMAQSTATGTERVFSVAEVQNAYQARNFANTLIKNTALLVHEELRDGDNGPISLKIADQWQQVDPAQWPSRSYCNVKMGYSMGERNKISATLAAALQGYAQGLQAYEGELFTRKGLYKMMVDFLTVNLIDNAESYYLDPDSQQAQQAGQQKQQMAQMQAKQTADQASQIAALPEQISAQKDKYKTDQETQFKYFDSVLQAQVEMHKAEREGVINFANARAEAADFRTAHAATPGKPGAGNGAPRANGKGGGNGTKPGK